MLDLDYKIEYKGPHQRSYFVYYKHWGRFWWLWAIFSPHTYQWKSLSSYSSPGEAEKAIKRHIAFTSQQKEEERVAKLGKYPQYFTGEFETNIDKVRIWRQEDHE